MKFSRRSALAASAMTLGALTLARRPGAALAAEGETETHGLSSFGELALGPDFRSFAYVNPNAPKGGSISLQVNSIGGNQNFETFDTLNIHILKGEGAAGVGMIFDSLMAGNADEPDAMYGLVARAVRVSADKLTYRFLLRPEARFHDGSKLTARDAAFSLNILKNQGHPNYQQNLEDMDVAVAESDDVLKVVLNKKRSRDLHLVVAGMPIFSQAWYTANTFDETTLVPPLGSSGYRIGKFEPGKFITFDRVKDYWAKDLPVNVGTGNFDAVRFEYFAERKVAFEGFKSGVFTFHEENTSIFWHNSYDFPAVKDGRIKKESVPDDSPRGAQGWFFNTRRDRFKDPRVREALGLAFDFEWTNKNIMFGSYVRTTSYFENSDMAAKGKPSPEELALLEPWRGKVPDEVFGEPLLPPVSDGSGQDRALLARASKLLAEAGCKRDGTSLKTPDGKPFDIEFLDSSPLFERHISPYVKNLKLLGINATSRVVDPAQYQKRTNAYDFDVMSIRHGSSVTPGEGLQGVFGSKAAKTEGQQNFPGISDPAVDALVDTILHAETRAGLNTACRALDRVLRAGRYWVPHWNNPSHWLAYWDIFQRPARTQKFVPSAYNSVAMATWWYDEDKAKRIKPGG